MREYKLPVEELVGSGYEECICDSDIKNIENLIEESLNENNIAICPQKSKIFRALKLTPLNKVKVVILGQDPYHTIRDGKRVADGLSFSSNIYGFIPPSLRRIFEQISKTTDYKTHESGDLSQWSEQGVLLLNTALTTENNNPFCHGRDWEKVTDKIISLISKKTNHTVFMLWGQYAKNKSVLIDKAKHHVLEGYHPSPNTGELWQLNDHFRECNHYLISNNKDPIDWNIY